MVAARLFEELPRHPVVTTTGVMKLLETTKPTATKAIALLEEVGGLSETTGRKRDRTFSYAKYLEHLRVGIELEQPFSLGFCCGGGPGTCGDTASMVSTGRHPCANL